VNSNPDDLESSAVTITICSRPSQTEYSAVWLPHIWHARAFSVAGPTGWNSLPDSLHDPAVESERLSAGFENASLCRRDIRDTSASEVSSFHVIALIDIYLLTYTQYTPYMSR